MNNKIPSKYSWLKKAEEGGVRVPQTLYISQQDMRSNNFQAPAKRFCEQHKDSLFIIRSCIEGEDGGSTSLAGHFTSSSAVKASEVFSTIRDLFEENWIQQKKLCPEGSTNLMLQVYIPMRLGGVCFTPWQYFYHYALVEFSSKGASAVVEGRKEGEVLLDVRSQEFKESWQQDLSAMVQKMCKTFKGPLDIEWGLSQSGEVYIFQVRPITSPVAGITSATADQVVIQKEKLESLIPGAWSLSGFSESLGILSPLSFSLWQNLYQKSVPELQKVGCDVSEDLFFSRALNGQVYSHEELEKKYFQPKGMKGAFTMAFKKSFLQKEIQQWIEKDIDSFSFKDLEQTFQYWLVSSIYADKKSLSFWGLPGEYELSWQQDLSNPLKPKEIDWESLRIYLKQRFVFQLSKLKKTLHPQNLFGTYDKSWNIIPGEYENAEESLVLYPSSFNESKRSSVVIVSGEGEFECETIFQPATFKGSLPVGKVIVAPYFDNRWVDQIPKLKGIVLEQGGALSHSAIVAREHQVPYIINVDNAVKIYKKELRIDLRRL